ncbi:MAG: tetratricopeptide repeat protein [bacterium]
MKAKLISLGIVLGLSLISGLTYGEWWRFWEGKPKKEKAKQERVVKKGSKNTKNQTQSLVLSKNGTSTDPAQPLLDEAHEFYKKSDWKVYTERNCAEGLEYCNKAIEKYEELVNKYPDSPLAPIALTMMNHTYMAKLECDPDNKPYYLEKSTECLKKILTDYPDSKEERSVRASIGARYMMKKNYPKALEYFQAQISKYPVEGTHTIPTYMMMAITYRRMGSYTEALSIFQKFKEENPNNAWVKWKVVDAEIADCYRDLEEFDKSLEINLKIIEEVDPRVHPRILELDLTIYNIAWIYDEIKKDYKNAEIWYKRLIKDYPDSEFKFDVRERLEELEAQGKLSTNKKKR